MTQKTSSDAETMASGTRAGSTQHNRSDPRRNEGAPVASQHADAATTRDDDTSPPARVGADQPAGILFG